jgi:2-C-methyl-D-erythritol 4-phosphate cytidylyltransferase
VVTGGATRAGSVRAALAAVPASADVVVIHDAAHPLASRALFDAVVQAVHDGADGAVPVLPTAETVVEVRRGRLTLLKHDAPLALAQMPHAFSARTLREAHADAPASRDDASLLLQRGARIAAVPGETTNVHVTTREELELAERLLTLPRLACPNSPPGH